MSEPHISSAQRLAIHVVDRYPNDYEGLVEAGDSHFVLLTFTTVHDALREARQRAGGVWLVNAKLAEMPGAEFVEMLRPLVGNTPIVVVSDQSDPAEELAARQHGATQYLVKPVAREWLQECFAKRNEKHQITSPATFAETSGLIGEATTRP